MDTDSAKPSLTHVGEAITTIPVSIGPQFLQLFSEHLYSSPNKAFEELVSNSWDAGASVVHVSVPEPSELASADAAVWVLDNGESMDLDGLILLWSVATSNKRAQPLSGRRPQIGKFGIGKLATYILADQLTYICQASDGQIRAVTMDYRDIQSRSTSGDQLYNQSPVELAVRKLTIAEVIASCPAALLLAEPPIS